MDNSSPAGFDKEVVIYQVLLLFAPSLTCLKAIDHVAALQFKLTLWICPKDIFRNLYKVFFLVPNRFHDIVSNEQRYWSLDFHDQERKLLEHRGDVKEIIKLLKVIISTTFHVCGFLASFLLVLSRL